MKTNNQMEPTTMTMSITVGKQENRFIHSVEFDKHWKTRHYHIYQDQTLI